jgi:hypothetical protein
MVFIAIILHLQNNRLVFFLEQSMGGWLYCLVPFCHFNSGFRQLYEFSPFSLTSMWTVTMLFLLF